MRQRGTQRRGRPILLVLLLGIIAVVAYYMRCGEGFGIAPGGESGVGEGERDRVRDDRNEKEPGDRVDRGADVRPAVGDGKGAARRCRLRLDSAGLSLDDEPSTVEEAVAACKRAGGAELTPTGGAVYGEVQRLREALDRAGVEVFVREPGTDPGR
jgi:hypothetical protein